MQIPFYHFCTVCCTRDLILLLDCRKGSILFFSWWFHGAGFSGRPEGRGVAIVGPPVAPLHLLTATPSGGGVDGAARGHAERREFSGLLLSVLLSFTVFVRRAVGQSPSPLFTPSVRNENHRTFLGQGSLFPAFLFLLLFLNQNQVCSQKCPTASGSQMLATAQSSPAPTPAGSKALGRLLLSSVVLCHLPGPTPPQFSDRVQEFVGLFSLTAVVTQSVSLQSLRL